MVSEIGRLPLAVSVISGPCETVFLGSLVTHPQGDIYSVILLSTASRPSGLPDVLYDKSPKLI